MKVILTGSTGFIGSEVLRQCLASSAITSIIAMSRKPIPDSAGTENSRLKTVILKDFESYFGRYTARSCRCRSLHLVQINPTSSEQ